MKPLELLQLELSLYTYRPGWEFELIPMANMQDTLALHITARVPAVDPPHQVIPIEFTLAITNIESLLKHPKDYLFHALKSAIYRLESHEFDEWFKYRGKHVTDPHPERKSP